MMISKDREHPIKKAAMIIFWRTQQISQIFSMVMLAISTTLLVNLYIEWRFSNTYIGMIITPIILAIAIYLAGYVWDKKGRMWHEQSVVAVERNPFNVHKMTPKEAIMYLKFWSPLATAIAELTDDDELRATATNLKIWCEDQVTKDPNLRVSVDDLRKQHFGGR